MSKDYCDHCESPLPPGCRHLAGDQDGCSLGPRTDLVWLVGMAVWKDLTDRRGIKNELRQCDESIQVEIIETIGRIAIEAMRKATR